MACRDKLKPSMPRIKFKAMKIMPTSLSVKQLKRELKITDDNAFEVESPIK